MKQTTERFYSWSYLTVCSRHGPWYTNSISQAPLTSDQTNNLTWRLYFLKDLPSYWPDRVGLKMPPSHWPPVPLPRPHWSIVT